MKKAVFLGLFLGASLPGLLPGQSRYFYVSDSNPSTGTLNVVPFGTGSGFWKNQRVQFLLKKTFLPGKGGMIRAGAFPPGFFCDVKFG